MTTETLTIREVAERIETDPTKLKDAGRNLARKIQYNLKNARLSADWSTAGIDDPSSVPCGKNDTFLDAFKSVIQIKGIELLDSGEDAAQEANTPSGVQSDPPKGDRSSQATAEGDEKPVRKTVKVRTAPSPRVRRTPTDILEGSRRDLDRKIRELPIGGKEYDRVLKKIVAMDEQIKEHYPKAIAGKPVRSFAEQMSPDWAVAAVILCVILSDGIASGWIYYSAEVDATEIVRMIRFGVFGLVGFVAGYVAVRSWLKTSDRETANVFMILFALWQLSLHTCAVFGYLTVGQVVVYVGATLALMGAIHSIDIKRG